jgi:hypothetical protein
LYVPPARTSRIASRGMALGVVGLAAVAGLLAPAANAASSVSPKGGFYKGLTDQGKAGAKCPDAKDPFGPGIPCQVTFRLKKGVVKDATFGIAWPNCSTTFPLSPATGKVNSKGKFKVTEGDSWLKGKFVTGKKVNGTASGQPVESAQFPGCDGTLTVSYTAKRQP